MTSFDARRGLLTFHSTRETQKGRTYEHQRERPLAGRSRSSPAVSRGIGAAIAKRLAADGASVAVTYSKGADAAASLVKEIERGGGKAIAIQATPPTPTAVRNAVDKTVKTLGRLDVLVNNAGTIIPMNVEETTLADFDRVFCGQCPRRLRPRRRRRSST